MPVLRTRSLVTQYARRDGLNVCRKILMVHAAEKICSRTVLDLYSGIFIAADKLEFQLSLLNDEGRESQNFVGVGIQNL